MFLSLRNIPPGFATKLQWLNATGKIVILCGCTVKSLWSNVRQVLVKTFAIEERD